MHDGESALKREKSTICLIVESNMQLSQRIGLQRKTQKICFCGRNKIGIGSNDDTNPNTNPKRPLRSLT